MELIKTESYAITPRDLQQFKVFVGNHATVPVEFELPPVQANMVGREFCIKTRGAASSYISLTDIEGPGGTAQDVPVEIKNDQVGLVICDGIYWYVCPKQADIDLTASPPHPSPYPANRDAVARPAHRAVP